MGLKLAERSKTCRSFRALQAVVGVAREVELPMLDEFLRCEPTSLALRRRTVGEMSPDRSTRMSRVRLRRRFRSEVEVDPVHIVRSRYARALADDAAPEIPAFWDVGLTTSDENVLRLRNLSEHVAAPRISEGAEAELRDHHLNPRHGSAGRLIHHLAPDRQGVMACRCGAGEHHRRECRAENQHGRARDPEISLSHASPRRSR